MQRGTEITVLRGQYKASGALQLKGKTVFMGLLTYSALMVMEVGKERQ